MEHHLEEDMERHQAEGMERLLEVEDMGVEDMDRRLQLAPVTEEASHHLADTGARLLVPIRSSGAGSRASILIDLGLSRRLSWRGR